MSVSVSVSVSVPWNSSFAMHARLCCKGTSLVTSRRLSDPAANIFTVMTHCNVFLNALIYISQYDAVRQPLISFARQIRDKFAPNQSQTAN